MAKKSGDKKKGKKGKKDKLSPSEKKLAKVLKECEELCKNQLFVENFMDRMDHWLLENGDILFSIFIKFDENSSGSVTYDEFKSALFDLKIPCTAIEQHLFCQLLDPKMTGFIEYVDLSNGLISLREKLMEGEDEGDEEHVEKEEDGVVEEPEDIEPIDSFTSVGYHTSSASLPLKRYEYPEHCLCCKMAICEPYREKEPKYVELLIRLASFEHMRNHPGHFEQVVHTHVPVAGLVEIIRTGTGLNSSKIGVFFDNSGNEPDLLDYSKSLDDYNIEGGTKHKPPKALLFYDYTVEFVGCPLLSCDFYFSDDS